MERSKRRVQKHVDPKNVDCAAIKKAEQNIAASPAKNNFCLEKSPLPKGPGSSTRRSRRSSVANSNSEVATSNIESGSTKNAPGNMSRNVKDKSAIGDDSKKEAPPTRRLSRRNTIDSLEGSPSYKSEEKTEKTDNLRRGRSHKSSVDAEHERNSGTVASKPGKSVAPKKEKRKSLKIEIPAATDEKAKVIGTIKTPVKCEPESDTELLPKKAVKAAAVVSAPDQVSLLRDVEEKINDATQKESYGVVSPSAVKIKQECLSSSECASQSDSEFTNIRERVSCRQSRLSLSRRKSNTSDTNCDGNNAKTTLLMDENANKSPEKHNIRQTRSSLSGSDTEKFSPQRPVSPAKKLLQNAKLLPRKRQKRGDVFSEYLKKKLTPKKKSPSGKSKLSSDGKSDKSKSPISEPIQNDKNTNLECQVSKKADSNEREGLKSFSEERKTSPKRRRSQRASQPVEEKSSVKTNKSLVKATNKSLVKATKKSPIKITSKPHVKSTKSTVAQSSETLENSEQSEPEPMDKEKVVITSEKVLETCPVQDTNLAVKSEMKEWPVTGSTEVSYSEFKKDILGSENGETAKDGDPTPKTKGKERTSIHTSSSSPKNNKTMAAQNSAKRKKRKTEEDVIESIKKRKMTEEDEVKQKAAAENADSKKVRPCHHAGCPAKAPVCFARIRSNCAGNQYTARWYHLSPGEHYCNNCFETMYRNRATKNCIGNGYTARWYHLSPGEHYCNTCFEILYRNKSQSKHSNVEKPYENYQIWRTTWSTNGQSDGSVNIYMADRFLPYWVQCQTCEKWRQMHRDTDMTPGFISTFTCAYSKNGAKKGPDPCAAPQDDRVDLVSSLWWPAFMSSHAFFTETPAGHFLATYPPDAVGMSAYTYTRTKDKSLKKESEEAEGNGMSEAHSEDQDLSVAGLSPYLQPFHQPNTPERVGTVQPDVMTAHEEDTFCAHAKSKYGKKLYLAVRNLAVALWNLNLKEWLTKERCTQHLVCRGLVRIHAVNLLDDVLYYLTVKGVINCGFVAPPPDLQVLPCSGEEEHVIVVGSGTAGLAVANQLHRFGIKTTVLEAQSRLGGRIWDDDSFGESIGRGAQILNGCVNNPFTIMSHQLNLKLTEIRDHCNVIFENGMVASSDLDNRIDFHFNQMLDNVAEWRESKNPQEDVSLLEKLQEMHDQFVQESQLTFSKEELGLLQFHFSNLEYACGEDLSKVSALHWDQNELYPQYAGPHVFMSRGYSPILHRLAEGLKIKYNTQVTSIEHAYNEVKVRDCKGQIYTGTRVVVTVPLTVLQSGNITFKPPLSQKKLHAINNIGCGVIEKVALSFPSRFWGKKIGDADFFGHVPAHKSDRGFFSVFYDMTSKKSTETGQHILMTYVSGQAVRLLKDKSDQEVIDLCCDKLAKLFPEEIVPAPTKSFVTRWGADKHTGLAYTYLKVGSSGDLYDMLAESINSTVFFAGEATNRQFPQSVTGAYTSGLREAEKIVVSVINKGTV